MSILLDDLSPLEFFPYQEITVPSINKPTLQHKVLPIYLGEWTKQDHVTVDLIIVCADLQGLVKKNGQYQLLGEVLPEFLRLLIDLEMDLPEDPTIGVFLCGDFFTSPTKRGSSGDVRNVWKTFANHFSWVVGVAGNHDYFGTPQENKTFQATKNINLLHHNSICIDGLKIGGISGIIGRADKTNRVEASQYISSLKKLLQQEADFILLHESPDYPPFGLKGNNIIRQCLEQAPKATICCGHCFWEQSLVTLQNETSILNVDSKVLLLKPT